MMHKLKALDRIKMDNVKKCAEILNHIKPNMITEIL